MTEHYRIENPEVLYSDAAITALDRSVIEHLKHLAAKNPRQRIRLCAHHDPRDKLHEMLIVHGRDVYVRPHKHVGKTESTHIIEGLVDVVVFDDEGGIARIIRMGDHASGRTFYYRMTIPAFHTLIIRSGVLVFHETTDGPFDRADTVFAPWAPDESSPAAATIFMRDLVNRVGAFDQSTQEGT